VDWRGIPLTIALALAATFGTPILTILIHRLFRKRWTNVHALWKYILQMQWVTRPLQIDSKLITALWVGGTCWVALVTGAGFILIDGPFEQYMGYVVMPSLAGLVFSIRWFYRSEVQASNQQGA